MEENKFKENNNNPILVINSYYKNIFNKITKKVSFILPVTILLLIFIASLIINYFVDKELYTTVNFSKAFLSPCSKYPFGTNEFGQNFFYQIFIGCFNTLKLAVIATSINLVVGIILGIVWGNSAKFDKLMIFIQTVLNNTPIVFFYIIIISVIGAGYFSLLIVIILFGWVNIACLIRNNLILIRNKSYNIASKLYKTPLYKRAINNYLPSILPIIFSSIAFSIPDVIAFEITMIYYGFDIGKENLSLGSLLQNSISINSFSSYPYLFFIPLAFLFTINICFYYMSKALSEITNKEGDINAKG